MYNEILTPVLEQTDNHFEQEKKKREEEKKSLTFHGILCPKTMNALSSKLCQKCEHKIEYRRKHPVGKTLTTFICDWKE